MDRRKEETKDKGLKGEKATTKQDAWCFLVNGMVWLRIRYLWSSIIITRKGRTTRKRAWMGGSGLVLIVRTTDTCYDQDFDFVERVS